MYNYVTMEFRRQSYFVIKTSLLCLLNSIVYNCSVLTTVFTCVDHKLLMMCSGFTFPQGALYNYCMTFAEGLHFSAFHYYCRWFF